MTMTIEKITFIKCVVCKHKPVISIATLDEANMAMVCKCSVVVVSTAITVLVLPISKFMALD